MAPLQLIHLTTVHPRNDTRIFVKQVQTLFAEFGATVSLVVADGLGDHNDVDGPSVHDLGRLPANRLQRIMLGNWRALMFARRFRPHLIHFHDPELIPLGLILRLFGSRIVYDVHEDAPRQTLSKHWIPAYLRLPISKAIEAMERLAAKAFSGIVAATPTIAVRFPPTKTVLVRNYPIEAEIVPTEAPSYDRRPQSFVYVGGVARIRGAVQMVECLDQLTERPEVKLQIAGGFSPAELVDQLRVMPAWSRVDYRGVVGRQAIAGLLAGSRGGLVLLHPVINYLDSLPVKMFEYMAAGLPIVASDFPLWREIVVDAQCGLLVDPLDPKAIADAMRWILDHPEQAEAMGRNGQAAVRNKYNWDRESKTLIDFYRTLLKSKN